MALTRPKYSQIYDSDFKNSARVATSSTITLAGGAPSTVDNIPLNVKDRVLVRLQNTASQNGIYMVTVVGTGNNGTWVRALDADTSSKLSPGTSISIEEGTLLAGKQYRMTTPGPITLGSTTITWTDTSGGGGAAGGINAQIQYNDVNAFGGASYLWYNENSGTIIANAGVASTSTSTGTIIVDGGVGVSGELNVGANVTVTGNVLPSANVTYNLGSPSQRWKDLYLSGTTINLNGATISATNGSISFQNSLGGSFSVTGSSSGQSTGTFGNLVANSGIASSSTSTGALVVTGGTGITGTLNVGGDIVVTGSLTVNGTTTTINATTLTVDDKNIELGSVTSPDDTTANGGGITLKGATDKTILWSTTGWTSSEDWNLATGKQYEINGTAVLSSTTLGSGVTASSLTSLGTITSLVATSSQTTTGVVTNFSTANAVVTGGSLNNTTIGATTHTTGRFTTVTATSISAGTIGNSGATLTGTLSTAAQTNITSVGTVTSGTWSASFGAVSGANLTSLTAGNLSGTIPSGVLGNSTHYIGTTAIALNRGSASQSLTGVNIDGSAGSATNLYGAGGNYIASSGSGTSYSTAIQVREAGLAGAQGSAIAYSPRLAFHWSGVVASSIVMEASGRIAIVNNPGTAYEAFACGVMTGTATSARYADLAENYQADAQYVPGTVLVFGGAYEVTTTDQTHNTAVAGIVSTNPAHLMNSELTGHGVVALGLTGRLPCRVQGPVAKGDVLVTSTTPGVAQRIDNSKFLPGCVVGKALESINTNNIQTIEVVVGRF